jgi:TPR repeat protein
MKIRAMVVCGALAFGAHALGADLNSAEKAFAQRDSQKALGQFRSLAKKNDATAQRRLGEMYRSGYGVARNLETAIEWFKRSAGGGDAIAQAALGSIFLDRKMYSESAAYFAQAAQQGHSEAQLQLGYSYALGQGVQASAADAAKWFQAVCEQGNKTVSLLAGTELRAGKIIPADAKAAAKCLERASSLGDLEAAAALGMMYLNGEGVLKDPDRSIKLLQMAANRGNIEAFYGLGLIYERGFGLRQDYVEAAKWFLKSASEGFASAQLALGRLYTQGLGVRVDYAQAIDLWEQASRRGNSEAQYTLGTCYADGRITTQDDLRAYMMLNLAAASGHVAAKAGRDNIAQRLSPTQIATAQQWAREWPNVHVQAPQIRRVFVAEIEGNNGVTTRQQVMALIANSRRFQIVDARNLADAIIVGRAESREDAREIASSETASRIAMARSLGAGGIAGDESQTRSTVVSRTRFSGVLLLRLVLPSGQTIWAWDDTEPCKGPEDGKAKCAVQDLVSSLGS